MRWRPLQRLRLEGNLKMTLDLNEQQVGYLMQSLALRPYAEVADLIANLHRQVSAQMAPQSDEARLRAIPTARKDEAPGH